MSRQESHLDEHTRAKDLLVQNNLFIAGGSNNGHFSSRVAQELGIKIDFPCTSHPDHETKVQLCDSVDSKTAIFIQVAYPNVAESIIELALLNDAARRSGASKIINFLPYFPYSRSDKKDEPRISIAARVVTDMLVSTGASRIGTFDLHNLAIEGFVNCPWDNIFVDQVMVPRILEVIDPTKTKVMPPDVGRAKRAEVWRNHMGACGVANVIKERDASGKIVKMTLVGDVDGYDVVIVDDIYATGETIHNAAVTCKKNGAKRVFAAFTFPIFAPGKEVKDRDSEENIGVRFFNDAPIDMLFTTDIVSLPKCLVDNQRIQEISVAPLAADMIARMCLGIPVSGGQSPFGNFPSLTE